MRGPNIRRRQIEYSKPLKLVRTIEGLNMMMQGIGHGERDIGSETGSPEKSIIKISEEKEHSDQILSKLRIKQYGKLASLKREAQGQSKT